MIQLDSKHLISYNCQVSSVQQETDTPDYRDHLPVNMRLTGYKLILLVSYIIILLFNLGTLYQLSYTGTPRERTDEAQEAERTLERGVTDQTSPPSYIMNTTKSEGNNNQSEVKIEMSRNSSLYYSALPGTGNSWTLFDIRRGAAKKRLEVIGVRWIIVDKNPS